METAFGWLFSPAYMAYVVGMALVWSALLGAVVGFAASVVLSLGPLVAAGLWAVRRS